MATRRTAETADELADAAAATGRRASARARKAGEDLGDAIEDVAETGARRVRRAGRRGAAAYHEAADEVEERVGSLEEAIRRNPLAAAGAALLVGVVLGRFIL